MHANDGSESTSLRYRCIILRINRATLKPTNKVIELNCHLLLVNNCYSLSPQSIGN